MIDGGSEFLSTEWRTYCTNEGINIKMTQPYSPKMNGIAERLNRVLTEHASAMLWEAELPIGFWAAAILNATYLKNRSPTSCLEHMPFEAYYGRPPNLGHVRTFGCRAHTHVTIEIRSKTTWDSHTLECILIGHLETENMYELWDIHKGEAIRRRDVIFWEDELGCAQLRMYALPKGTEFLPIDRQFVESFQSTNPTISTPPTSSVPHLPLKQLPEQQSVTSLPTQDAQADRNELIFKHWDPSQLKPKPRNTFPKPTISLNPPTLNAPHQAVIVISTGCERFEIEKAMVGSEEWLVWDNIVTEHHIRVPDLCSNLLMKAMADIDVDISSSYPPRKIPRSYYEAMKSTNCLHWKSAIERELKKLTDMGTWELVELPPGKRAIDNKWVYSFTGGAKKSKLEQEPDVARMKARLVARGDR